MFVCFWLVSFSIFVVGCRNYWSFLCGFLVFCFWFVVWWCWNWCLWGVDWDFCLFCLGCLVCNLCGFLVYGFVLVCCVVYWWRGILVCWLGFGGNLLFLVVIFVCWDRKIVGFEVVDYWWSWFLVLYLRVGKWFVWFW